MSRTLSIMLTVGIVLVAALSTQPTSLAEDRIVGEIYEDAQGRWFAVLPLDILDIDPSSDSPDLDALDSESRGWLSNATGGAISTPQPIQSIAPNGIRFGRPGNDTSTFHHVPNPPYMDNNGYVWDNGRRVGQGSKKWHNGRQYYVATYKGRTYSKPVPQQNSGNIQFGPTQSKPLYSINANSGAVYYGQQYKKQARRIRFSRSGRTGWYALVDASTVAYRYDGSSRTSTTSFGNLGRL